ncbi:alanine racemase [Aquihabitans daechungensis]|uniref:alanine racemase n=1 Tax=Aquihabitans daechungensis TaxID=1052257 RepID=UPI003B9F95D8
MRIEELPTPALVVDRDLLDANIARMGVAWPGTRLRPHVKAFKSTGLAKRLAAAGHTAFCGATVRELAGMAAAGLGGDLLLANEVVDVGRLRALVDGVPEARVTVAVDSPETIEAAVAGGIREVLIDVAVGMPRCGCAPDDAGRLAELARSKGLGVRGVMGYEGHLMTEAVDQGAKVEEAMALLLDAHDAVGGDVISGGGTGTWSKNHWVTELPGRELHAHGHALRGSGRRLRQGAGPPAHRRVRRPHRRVGDGRRGLKALGMDHGNAAIDGADVWYHADEHTVFSPRDGAPLPAVGDRITVWPAHVDPTVSQHEQLWVHQAGDVVDCWPVDLRNW